MTDTQAPVAEEVLDEFGPATGRSMDDIDGATRRLAGALMERMLSGALSQHLGDPPGGDNAAATSHHRHGSSPKTVVTADGPVALAVPRERAGTVAPVCVPKHARRRAGLDDHVLALYARGRPTREIQKVLEAIYGLEGAPPRIRAVTNAVVVEVTAWHARPLDSMYPVVFVDALRVKSRDESVVPRNAVKGMPDALEAAYPTTTLPPCLVHLIRRRLDLGGWNDRKLVARARRTIYAAPSAAVAAAALEAFAARIYTTNILERVHARMRQVITTRGPCPTDEAALNLIGLALRNLMAGWTAQASRHGRETIHEFAIWYGDRFLRESA